MTTRPSTSGVLALRAPGAGAQTPASRSWGRDGAVMAGYGGSAPREHEGDRSVWGGAVLGGEAGGATDARRAVLLTTASPPSRLGERTGSVLSLVGFVA